MGDLNQLFSMAIQNRIQVFAIVMSILFFLFVVRLVKRKHIKVEYSLLWLGFASFFVLMAIFRDLVDLTAAIMGIAYAPAAFLLLLMVSAFCILIQYSIVISNLSDKCRVLTQELAILRQQFDQSCEKNQKKDIGP